MDHYNRGTPPPSPTPALPSPTLPHYPCSVQQVIGSWRDDDLGLLLHREVLPLEGGVHVVLVHLQDLGGGEGGAGEEGGER